MKKYFVLVGKFLLCYLLAGAASLMVQKWPHYGGHADIPFSGFPEFLLWAPITPYFLVTDLFGPARAEIGALCVFVLTFLVAASLLLRKR